MANSDDPPPATPSPQTGDERARARTAPADLLAQIVDHLPIALTVQDHHGRFILVNAAAAANLDIPENAANGRSIWFDRGNRARSRKKSWGRPGSRPCSHGTSRCGSAINPSCSP